MLNELKFSHKLILNLQHLELPENIHGAFIVAPVDFTEFMTAKDLRSISYCCTTRENNDEIISFPGGKLKRGEDVLGGALRECKEEGWERPKVKGYRSAIPFHVENVDGNYVVWLCSTVPFLKLTEYKEKHRDILPIEAKVTYHFKNHAALTALQKIRDR